MALDTMTRRHMRGGVYVSKTHVVLSVCWVLVLGLLGSSLGGIVGNHCETCSADGSRLLLGAGTTGALMLGAATYHAWQRRWTKAATMAILLLPAAYFSATLAQRIGIWWDRL